VVKSGRLKLTQSDAVCKTKSGLLHNNWDGGKTSLELPAMFRFDCLEV
jgi:hypothetical protein